MIANENVHPPRVRAITLLALVWLVVIISAIAVLAADMLLVLFLGGIFGVFLVQCAQAIGRFVSWDYKWRLTAVVSLLLLFFTGFAVLAGWQFSRHVDEFAHQLDVGVERLKELAEEYPSLDTTLRATPMLRQAVYQMPAESGTPQSETTAPASDESNQDESNQDESNSSEEQSQSQSQPLAAGHNAYSKLAATGQSIFRTTYGLVVNVALIFFIGIFLAAAPRQYTRGIILLTPRRYQARCDRVLHHVFHTLRHWLIGRFATMFITGLGAAIVLWIAGVPMAGTIGVLTGLLAFIPNIGAAVALALAVVAALPQGTGTVIAVTIGYIVLQLLESYVITPLIQQHEVSVLPALLLAVQAIMSILFGFVGALTASPLLAAIRAVIQKTYLEDKTEDPSEPHPSADNSRHYARQAEATP